MFSVFLHSFINLIILPFVVTTQKFYYLTLHMAFPVILLALLVFSHCGYSQRSPSPGYYPSSRVPTSPYDRDFRTQWGFQHQRREHDITTLWLDKASGLVLSFFFFFFNSILFFLFHLFRVHPNLSIYWSIFCVHVIYV